MLISISPNEDSWRSGNISPNEALYFFDCLINMNPSVPMPSFNILFTVLCKNKQYDSVVSL